MRAGPDLDVFVFRYVFDGLVEWEVDRFGGTKLSRPLPSFSRKADAAKLLMVKIVVGHPESGGGLTIRFNDVNLKMAKVYEQTLKADTGPMWRVDFGNHSGFGKRFEEALCKLAIKMKEAGEI